MKSWAKAKLSQSAYAEGGVYPNWFAGAFYVYFVIFLLMLLLLLLHALLFFVCVYALLIFCFCTKFLWVISLWHARARVKGKEREQSENMRVHGYACVYMCECRSAYVCGERLLSK